MSSPPNVILIVDHYSLGEWPLYPSCLINKLRRSSYRVTRMATLHDYSRNVVKYSQIEIHIYAPAGKNISLLFSLQPSRVSLKKTLLRTGIITVCFFFILANFS